ncbi:YtxH domain-containing protein [Metasolibacillus sp. FSL H7-0170]|uniref:YtxH domain-containing protein n=1 Tax=Metasolibacillus TaxID=2703677 RepID=UPI0007980F41|nr:YtxH domain-containing protein [Metasolibacillus fluoroglycofenilyticus]KYG90698.1 gas vesicle protein [[Bacillus] sp. KCTC 13219]
MKAKPFLIGLTAGIVGGAIATILSAPQSGKELRTNITSFSTSTKERLNDVNFQTKNVKQSFSNLSNEVKNNIPQIIKELSQSFTSFKQQIEPETALLKQEIEGLQKSIGEIEQNLSQFTEKDEKQKQV